MFIRQNFVLLETTTSFPTVCKDFGQGQILGEGNKTLMRIDYTALGPWLDVVGKGPMQRKI